MNRKFSFALFFSFLVFSFTCASAQNNAAPQSPVYKVGVFAPLYLDSVFANNTFKYRGLPRFIMPGLDFVQGAQIAFDSMQIDNVLVEAVIYDSKAFTKTIPWLIQNKKLDSLNLIIGSVKDEEYKELADFALLKNIPFISATYPNVGGVTKNPFVAIINPTLKAHCDAIYSYILQNSGTDKIILCRQKGPQEDMVAGYFKQINEQDGKALLPIQTVSFDENFKAELLKAKMDSTKKTIIIGASLDETFASNLVRICYEMHNTYPITLIGMPTWDGFTSIHKKDDFADFPVYFTTAYYNNKWDAYSKIVTNAYAKKYKGKPSDMAFKGFEAAYLFTKLLIKYPDNFMSQINDKTYKIFTEYNFRPVLLKKDSTVPDYFENKHLYFLKILNGSITRAW